MQQLGDDQIRDLVVHGRAEEDDPLVEQAGVDVERALPTGGLFDDHRYEWAHGPRFVSLSLLESFRWQTARAAPLGRRLAMGRARPARVPARTGRSATGRPELAARRLAGAGGPELVARLCLLDADRRGRLDHQVQRLALRQIVLERVQPAVGAQA